MAKDMSLEIGLLTLLTLLILVRNLVVLQSIVLDILDNLCRKPTDLFLELVRIDSILHYSMFTDIWEPVLQSVPQKIPHLTSSGLSYESWKSLFVRTIRALSIDDCWQEIFMRGTVTSDGWNSNPCLQMVFVVDSKASAKKVSLFHPILIYQLFEWMAAHYAEIEKEMTKDLLTIYAPEEIEKMDRRHQFVEYTKFTIGPDTIETHSML